MKTLTEKELYQIQLSISEELFGHAARICDKRQKILNAALKATIKALETQGIAFISRVPTTPAERTHDE